MAKAEPISYSGSTSVTTFLKKGKKILCNSSWERRVRICERNNSADTTISEEGGRTGTQCSRTEVPLQPTEKTMVTQVVPLQPMEYHRYPLAAHEGPHTRAGGCALKEAVTPWKACAGAGSWQKLWLMERIPCSTRISGSNCALYGDHHWSSPFMENCTLWKGPMMG